MSVDCMTFVFERMCAMWRVRVKVGLILFIGSGFDYLGLRFVFITLVPLRLCGHFGF